MLKLTENLGCYDVDRSAHFSQNTANFTECVMGMKLSIILDPDHVALTLISIHLMICVTWQTRL